MASADSIKGKFDQFVSEVAPAATIKPQKLESPSPKPHDPDMSSITREEHDAKLAAAEARTALHVGKIEAMLANVVSGIGRIEADAIATKSAITDANRAIEESRRHTTNVGFAIAGGLIAMLALAFTIYQTGLTGRQVIGAPVTAAPAVTAIEEQKALEAPQAAQTKSLPAQTPSAPSDATQPK